MTLATVLSELRKRPGTGDIIPLIDPSTEEQFGEFADGGTAAVNEAVARARASFKSGVWHNKTASDRSRILWRVAELIEENADVIGAIDSKNTGMPFAQARGILFACSEQFRYYAGWCTKIDGIARDVKMSGGLAGGSFADLHAYTIKEPIGVVALIVPWNGPTFNATTKLAPALAAGCSCILKPAEETPLSAFLLENILLEAGVPDGVVNVVTGFGHTVGAALSAHPGVDKVAFTGSTEVGKLIVQAAADNLKKVMLELGGKSPVLIYDDADLAKAIPTAAMGIFVNSGQGCICGSRIFVQRGVHDQVVEGLAQMGRSLRLGGSTDTDVDIGPLISRKQLTRVLGYIDEGKQEGVEVVSGGNRMDRPGFFVQPTVLANVRPDMRLYREEIFGPVVTVMAFEDDEEVITAANDTIYGLSSNVWTRDIGRAHSLAKRLEAGTVNLNCQMVWDPSIPIGGHKQSGWGQEYGRDGLEGYLKTKTVHTML